jgi:isoaspartyl peptidase/L-asparaginase-like protein (Ntn-hydrolase superfamily)
MLERLRPVDRGSSSDGALFGIDGATDEARWMHHDTIGTLCIDRADSMAGACSTSGTPFKVPGRVGDSPIIGHGLYVDPSVGAATATGTGELIMGVCGSFLAVELMRQGMSPREATAAVVARIRDEFKLRPEHQVAIVALHRDGAWSSAALRPGFLAAARDDAGERLVPAETIIMPEETKP